MSEKVEQARQSRRRFVAREQDDHLEETGTDGAAGQGDPHDMDKLSGFNAALRCRSSYRRFHMCFIEGTRHGERVCQGRHVPRQANEAKMLFYRLALELDRFDEQWPGLLNEIPQVLRPRPQQLE